VLDNLSMIVLCRISAGFSGRVHNDSGSRRIIDWEVIQPSKQAR
jgi:hypothetical protein